jgi:hypothetical protein
LIIVQENRLRGKQSVASDAGPADGSSPDPPAETDASPSRSVPSDADEGWHAVFVPGHGSTAGSHRLLLPAAVAVEFRVRAHGSGGAVTPFSDPLRVHVGADHRRLSVAPFGGAGGPEDLFAVGASRGGHGRCQSGGGGSSSATASEVVQVVVRASAHIESVAFLFADGSRHAFASLAADAQRRRAVDAAAKKGQSWAPDGSDDWRAAADAAEAAALALARPAADHRHGSSSNGRDASRSSGGRARGVAPAKAPPTPLGPHGGVLLLGRHEHVVEVRGLTSEFFTEAVELVTSHGRKHRFATPAAGDRAADVVAGLAAPWGRTRGFRFAAAAGRCVVGLELKPTGLAADPRQSEGFLVVGALFADVPNLSERETKAAAAAVKAQGIARQAAATYAVAGDSNGDDDGGGQASGGKAAELPGAGTARERAAAQRRKAEREAARAMQAFQETLRARAAAAAASDQALLRHGSGDQGAPFKSKTGPTGLQSAPAAEGARRPFGVDAQFANNCGDRVAVSWVDYRGKEVVYCHLERAQSKRIRTFAGHCWVARVAATGEIAHVVRVARDDAPVYWIGGKKEH